MKLALAQLNTTVGDIAGNETKIIAAYQRGVAEGVAERVVLSAAAAATGVAVCTAGDAVSAGRRVVPQAASRAAVAMIAAAGRRVDRRVFMDVSLQGLTVRATVGGVPAARC